ncbi:crotonase/enoyl-CoA hydratase family protein [Planctomonas psychrotolerans]|uniref:crotonase/enoyl-CoA hydratase family protein n=1 Tax=Planctomonas psychrotolerans TaxID=2528712 RepID=UPI00123B2DF6|nr:crotonase/enoyl-CoA hydratase family protein [Planctomonas psychrotolerans]
MTGTPDTNSDVAAEPRVLVERRGSVLLLGLNRPDKRNAADLRMLSELALAYGEFDRTPELRVAVVHAVGDHFTAGLDLADIAPAIGRGTDGGLDMVPEGGINPWQVDGRTLSKPVVVAVQGTCLTLGIELALASDIVVAAESTRFGQVEVSRGILPFGGATLRFPRAVGWGNAMRWMLTGDMFDAAEALRMGLVQEVVPDGDQLPRAIALAERIAAQAPLAVAATLTNARRAIREGDAAAEAELPAELVRLAGSEDARIGMAAFLSRTPAKFVGR